MQLPFPASCVQEGSAASICEKATRAIPFHDRRPATIEWEGRHIPSVTLRPLRERNPGLVMMNRISKALENGPESSQTGPAVRMDKGTINKHIDLLSFSPDLQNLYREITKSIMRFYKKEN